MNKIFIFTTKFGYYIANVLKCILLKLSIETYIVYDIDLSNEDLYIILFSQKVKIFPKNYIIYQLEQKDISKWINTKYELSIYHSIITFDYSQSNILKFNNIIKKKIVYFPIPLIPIYNLNNKFNINLNPTNNILFYGSMNNIRKKKLYILQKKLYPKYNIKIVNNMYGENLINEILNSKIILNIHFYENAILETCRLNEILSCNRCVISEKPSNIDIINYDLYKNIVIFSENINDMYNKIIYILNNNLYKINLNYDLINNTINCKNILDYLPTNFNNIN
jgi:hypothetical protein